MTGAGSGTEMPELLRRAMTLHRQGRDDEAETSYAQFLVAEPDHAQALRLRGILARQRGEIALSMQLLEEAARIAAVDPEPLCELALSRITAGDYDAAERALRDAIARDAESLKAQANLGALLQHRGHVAEAIDCYRRVLVLDAADLETRCNLANALGEAGRADEALAEADAALEIAPGHPILLATKGAVLVGAGDYGRAIPVLADAVAENPADDMAWTNLAHAQLRLGQRAGAAASLRRAADANPDNARAVSDLVNLLAADGGGDEALGLAGHFLERHPGERLVVAAYGYALHEVGRREAARRIFDYRNLVRPIDVEPPPGFDDLQSFNAALAERIRADRSLQPDPAGKATRGGQQTGELNLLGDPVSAALKALIDTAVTGVSAELSAGYGGHPAMAFRSAKWTLRPWGVILEAGGAQAPHMHPIGWLSGVYYVELPQDMDEGAGHGGWLEFGAPPERYVLATVPETHVVQPAEGRLVLFPSYFYHRTLPFMSGGSRVCIAFDVIPAIA